MILQFPSNPNHSMILGTDLASVKTTGVNKPAMGEHTGEHLHSSLSPPLHTTDGIVLWAVSLPAEGIPLKSRFMALKGCPWREEQHFKVSQ